MARQGILFIIAIMALVSCKREQPSQWEVDGLVPVAYGHLTLASLIPDTLLTADADGLLHLHFDENLTDFELDSLVEIPDTTIRKSFTPGFVGGPISIPPGTSVLDQETENVFQVTDVELKKVSMKGGTMEFTVFNHMNGQLVLSYGLPGVTKSGVPVEFEEILPPGSGENPSIFEGSIPLENYNFDFTGSSGAGSNTIVSIFSASVDPNGPGDASVFGTDSLVVDVRFVEPKVRYARGYFGEHEIEVRDTTNFELLSALAGGNLLIDQVDLSLDIVNRVGADAQIDIHAIKGFNSFNDELVTVQNESLTDQINITRAFDNNGTVEPTYYSISLDEANSNIDAFISNLPDELILDIDVHVNPLGNVSANNDFIYTDQPLDAHLVADIPLCVTMDNLRISDTLKIENTLDFTATGKIYLYVENAFPFGASVSVEVLDENAEAQAVLSAEESLFSGVYQDVGTMVEESSSVLELEFAEGSIESLNIDNEIVITVVFDSYNSDAVKLTESNYLDFKVVADVEALIEVE